NAAHGYYLSMGGIREVWVKQKWELGPLGFPKSDIVKDANGVEYQEYDGGTIYYSTASGGWVI
ncbi:hypothetical protein IKW73_03380, partial [Candidatus Saccharibacteria bacterium]|nr:hypothetical protein [Candidatus Saccharibacteria bacterium]